MPFASSFTFVECSSTASLKEAQNAISNQRCCLVFQCTGAGSRKQLKLANELLVFQLRSQSPTAVLCRSDSAIVFFTKWKEFTPLPNHANVFVFGTADWGKMMTSENIYYELGDHAEDDIAKVSATRRKVVAIENHFDDCGDDISALDLPPETFYQQTFDTMSEDEPSSEEDELFSSSFFNAHGFGSSYVCSDTDLSSFEKAYLVLSKWPTAKGVDFV